MNPRALMEQIPELRGRTATLTRLFGGLTNRTYLLEGTFGRWVLRINRDAPGVDREREARVLEQVRSAGMGPEIIRIDSNAGYLLYHYLAMAAWTPRFARSVAGQRQLGPWLRRLHELAADVDQVDPLAALKGYLRELPARQQDKLGEPVEALTESLAAVDFADEPPMLCHFDLVAGNLLGRGEALRAVDWEYSGLGPAPLDVAFYLHYQSLSIRQGRPLLESYAHGGELSRLIEILPPYLELARLLERTWLELKAARDTPAE